MNLEQNLIRTRAETRARMSKRNNKYIWWLKALEHSGLLLRDRDRGKMLEVDYLWMRYVDDVVDGQLTLPAGYISKEQFVSEKKWFL